MQGKYPFEIQGHYPHMKPADVHIWEKFIKQNPGYFESVDYDLNVGRPPEWHTANEDPSARKQDINYRKKIDVVAYKDGWVWLIEIKPQSGSNALGQVLTYKPLYLIEYPGTERIRLAILTNKAQNQYDKVYDHHAVRLFEVGICERCAHYGNR